MDLTLRVGTPFVVAIHLVIDINTSGSSGGSTTSVQMKASAEVCFSKYFTKIQ